MPSTLASRFLLTLLATAVLPFVVFGWFSLRGMRAVVDDQVADVFLPRLAADQAQKIDSRLQQIAQACSVVREIARRVLDDPQQLPAFEEQVSLVPDLLANHLDLILLADGAGTVVYREEGYLLDRSTRGHRARLTPERVDDTGWFRRVAAGEGLFWLPLGRSPYLHRGLDFASRDPADYHLTLVLDVPYGGGGRGAMLTLVRWPEVQRLLDEARTLLTGSARLPSAEVFLVDPQGVVQAHTDRLRYGERLEAGLQRQFDVGEPSRVTLTDPVLGECECGVAAIGEEANRRWSLVVKVPSRELFATSIRFGDVLVLALLITVTVLALWSFTASRAIVRPVQRMMAAAKRIAGGDLDVSVATGGGAELSELGTAFNAMAADLRRGREQLKAAERHAAWAEMARQVAHEIKNPLTPMRMSAQLLSRAIAEGDPRAAEMAERLARTVVAQTGELDRIASAFRQFAGAPVHRPEPVGCDEFLRTFAEQAATLFADGAVTVRCEAGAGDAQVLIDRSEIQRVLLNLVQNAAQAKGSPVTVVLRSRLDGGTVTIDIADDGPGIADEARARLFEPYFTTKSSGTGLGLAICRRVVEAHRGTIGLLVTGPAGTTFRIVLPVA